MNFRKMKEILRRRGMTQLQLAITAKISPFRLSRLLNKRARLRRADCRRIATALGVPVGDVLARPRHRSGKGR
jgi:transcriptional regulator with XRE-family HTH domain